ncbi:ribonuclease T2-like protein [Syncephalastrum racemosum]|uniref:ribonuclease T2 n=1 Tax=Syncephalastrum racemosum TaxID=13706 RepID=A0A1X2HLU4_SYNRA|nr:ribonuclease T2-like protein [Syncephalastrum racemosum]
MRLLIPLLLSTLYTTTLSGAQHLHLQTQQQQQEQTIFSPAPVCNRTVLSCHWQAPVDSCCSPKYGLVVLALQWVPGYGPDKEFTIHGLWPDTCSGGRAPGNGCDRTRRSNAIGPIVKHLAPDVYQRMRVFWPSYKDNDNWFWSHEWTKHGTCVSTLRPACYGEKYKKYQEVVEYFGKVLDLRDEYDIYGALNAASVFPGRVYNVHTIASALHDAFGVKMRLDCDRNGQLKEISLFFYVQGRDDYQLTDAFQTGSCRGPVWYPKKS